LDFVIQISRVAEVLATGLYFARAMGCEESTTSVHCGFRWSELAGRLLTSWSNNRIGYTSHAAAQQAEVTSFVTLPLETPQSGIALHVVTAVRPLFQLFGGQEFHGHVVEGHVTRFFQERY
jgi:hypothetical protein